MIDSCDFFVHFSLCVKSIYFSYFYNQAIKMDSTFASKVKRIVILGGAFFALGNVSPAAEANVSC